MNKKITSANNPNFSTFLLIMEPAILVSDSGEEMQESPSEGVREDDMLEGGANLVAREHLEDEEQKSGELSG